MVGHGIIDFVAKTKCAHLDIGMKSQNIANSTRTFGYVSERERR